MPENNYPMHFWDSESFSAMVENALKVPAALETNALIMSMSDTIAESLQNLTVFDLAALSQPMVNPLTNNLQNFTFPTIPTFDISPVINAMQTVSQIPWENQLDQMAQAIQTINETNYEIILHAMESAVPHLGEEQRKACEEKIIPKLKSPQKEPMTRSDWIAVFSLLLALITWLSSLLPDQQQQQQIDQKEIIIQQNETMIQQNEIIIQQNDRRIELDEERNELIKNCAIALNGVAGILESFPDDTDSTSEDINLQQADPPDGPKEEQGCLDELPNAQDQTGTL